MEGEGSGSSRVTQGSQPTELRHSSDTFPALQRPSSLARTYDSVRVAGQATAIFGDVHRSVHYHVRPRLDIPPDISLTSSDGSPPSSSGGYRSELYSQPGPSFPPWLLPLQNRQRFFGRETLIGHIENILFDNHSPEYGCIALTGLGGIGKSRCAMEIAYRTKATRPECSVFWVQATNLKTVQEGYRYIAKTLRLQSTKNPEQTMELVRQHLSSDFAGQYLLILDDADDSCAWVRGLPGSGSSRPLLMDYIPRHAQGAILLTTRSRQVAVRIAGKNILPVDVLDTGSACHLLQSRLCMPTADESEAIEMVKWLTCCPLAVMRAADFVNETNIKLSTLLRLFQKNTATIVELIGIDAEDVNDDRSAQAIRETWLLSLEHIRREEPHAFKILAYMCCLGPIDVSFRLLPAAPSLLTQVRSLGLLTGYGVLQRTGDQDESSTFTVQWLAYIAARNWLERTGDLHNIITAALTETIVLLSNDTGSETTEQLSSYLPCLLRLHEAGSKAKIECRNRMLELAAGLYGKYNLLKARKQCLERLQSDSLSTVGQDHFQTAFYSVMLGETLLDLKDYRRAKDQLQKALSSCLGQSDPSVWVNWYTVVCHLCNLCREFGGNDHDIELVNHMFESVHKAISDDYGTNATSKNLAKDVTQLWLDTNLTNSNGQFHASVQPGRLKDFISRSSTVYGKSHTVTKQLKCGLAILELNLPGHRDRGYLIEAQNNITDVLGPNNTRLGRIAARLERVKQKEIEKIRAVVDPILKDVSNRDWSAADKRMLHMDRKNFMHISGEEAAILNMVSLYRMVRWEQPKNFEQVFTDVSPYISSPVVSRGIRVLEVVTMERYQPTSYPWYGGGDIVKPIRSFKIKPFLRYEWSDCSRPDKIPPSILAATTILSCMWRSRGIRCRGHVLKKRKICDFDHIQDFVSTIVYELCRHKKAAQAAQFLEACVLCYGSCPMWFVTRWGETDDYSHTTITARRLTTMRVLELTYRFDLQGRCSSPVYANRKMQKVASGALIVGVGSMAIVALGPFGLPFLMWLQERQHQHH